MLCPLSGRQRRAPAVVVRPLRPDGLIASQPGRGAPWRIGLVGQVAGARVQGWCCHPRRAGRELSGVRPPTPCPGYWSAAGPLGRASAVFRPPGGGLAADAGREAADEPDAPLLPGRGPCGALPVALARPAWEWWGCASAWCGASSTGAWDRRQAMSVRSEGRWGLHGLCVHPRGTRLATPRGLACGCGAGIGQGFLLPGAGLASARRASRPSSPAHEGCLGPIAVRMVGGHFRVCRRGKPQRAVAPGGVSGSHGVAFALGAPGPLQTVVADVARRVPGSPGTQGWSKKNSLPCPSWRA